jgi:peptidoglycan hydrolase-like protein with peptidoglycan-binding domain
MSARAAVGSARRHRHASGAVALGASLLLLLSACTGDDAGPDPTPKSDVEVAQANVTAKEQALADAQTAATDAAAAFCDASSTYITALDRYGDVLNQTEVTVGDVQTAGSDLADPAAESKDAGDKAVDAREAVVQAQQDLAAAQADLAAAQAAAAGEPAPEPTEESPSPVPTVPEASVTRVQQAEDEFASAQAGITQETPLVQASEQFNSAAVALEMAWLRLFADSGCLSDERQAQASSTVSAYTVALQQSLADTGYYTGAVDGIYGPQTVAAVQALQKENGLPETGTVDKATAAALQAAVEAKAGADAQVATATTAALQQTLKLAGYWDGPIDGQWSDALTAAVGAAQTDLGVPVTGTVDAATLTAFQAALTAAKAAASAEPSTEAPTEEPSPTDEG